MGQVFKVPAVARGPSIQGTCCIVHTEFCFHILQCYCTNIVLTAVILQQLLKDMFCNIQTHFLLCEACVCVCVLYVQLILLWGHILSSSCFILHVFVTCFFRKKYQEQIGFRCHQSVCDTGNLTLCSECEPWNSLPRPN